MPVETSKTDEFFVKSSDVGTFQTHLRHTSRTATKYPIEEQDTTVKRKGKIKRLGYIRS